MYYPDVLLDTCLGTSIFETALFFKFLRDAGKETKKAFSDVKHTYKQLNEMEG